MPAKQVKVKIATEEDLTGVEALELKVKELNKQKIQLQIDANQQKLDETKAKIEDLKKQKAELDVDADDSKIKEIDAEIAQLEQKSLDLELKVETGELEKAKIEIEELDDEELEIQLRNQSAMEAIDQISGGFDRLKQGASEVGEQMGEILGSAGRMEQTESFLTMNMGATQAKKTIQDIREVTDALPGDDVALQNLLSQAAMKDATVNFKQMGNAAANYMAAMENFGKTSTETQQDLMNYILAGNTAEIERSPVLQAHIDKLKEGNTVQERSLLLQQALNEEGWMKDDEGIANQELYNNKLQTFNDMLERGKMNLGDMFLKGSEGAMDFLTKLDDDTNGLVGMAVALGGFASPLTDTLFGLGQMATGMKAIKDLGFIKWLKELELTNWLTAASEWAVAHPILLVTLLIVALIAILAYLYFNNEQVRQSIDGLGQALIGLGQWIYSGAIYWLNQLKSTLENLWNYIVTLGGLLPANVNITGNSIIDTILRVLAFIATLPLQIAMIFTNIIAKALGFGDNFSQRMIKAASDAINGFIKYIKQLPDIVLGEFNRVLGLVNDFINELPSKVWDMGVAIIGALKSALGIGSPGHMYYMVEGEFNRIDNLTRKTRFDTSKIGQDMVDSFNPEFSTDWDYNNSMNSILEKLNDGNFANGGITFNLYGDIDNEERMNKTVDAVVRRLAWDNKTAGRTV